ncbi:S-adenosyl-L-methionine-dependent methyltransferase [Vararia minispora EC-137]|uniref:S-adenosyl-L-methionine-dependent methyltransferase n=1 Tax=Vararia minispora EC-137 TaxID=1314806 RepID=A0ACB8QY41_9AGAM|nr:S-adenosyl-L-methionine-dependent methyltransferase [Vararia minispora EC-137]
MSPEPCRSLFDNSTHPSAAAALVHDSTTHGVDIDGLCAQLGLDFHGRTRLINWIRREHPDPGAVRALTPSESFLCSDDYLVPTLPDDPLLRANDGPHAEHADAWSDDDEDDAAAEPTRRIRALEAQLAATQRELESLALIARTRLGVRSDDGPSTGGDDAEPEACAVPQRDDDTHYFESYGANEIHAVMIQDKVRTSTYASFILGNPDLFVDKVVLDVGCGTGILSLFAAKAGAAHVYAVDASGIADRARAIVRANGYEDTITVIRGKVEDIVLPDGAQVDVIVSEWMGYALLYESMLDSVLAARDRFLKPGGVLAPSQARMELVLCAADEVYKERVEFWSDVYGFDMVPMAEEVFHEAVVDVVGPETVLSEPQTVKDIYLAGAVPRQLDFVAPFSLTSTSARKCKAHALVLYFDAFFTPDGVRLPSETKARVVPVGAAEVAEVWPLRRRLSRRMSAHGSSKPVVTSFSTGPASVPTHWKQTLFLLREPIVVDEGTIVEGTFHCRKNADNSRELDVEIHYTVRLSADAPAPADVVVQIYKIR